MIWHLFFGDLSRTEKLSEIKLPSFVFLFFFIGKQKHIFFMKIFLFVFRTKQFKDDSEDFTQSIKLKVGNRPAEDLKTLSYHISCFNLLSFDEFFQV